MLYSFTFIHVNIVVVLLAVTDQRLSRSRLPEDPQEQAAGVQAGGGPAARPRQAHQDDVLVMALGPRAAGQRHCLRRRLSPATAPLQRRLTSARGGATGGDATVPRAAWHRGRPERGRGDQGQNARNPRRACVCLRVSVFPSGSLSPPLVFGRQDLTLLPSPGLVAQRRQRRAGGRAGGGGRLRGATCERLGCVAAAVFLVLKTLYTHWERHLSEVMVCL